ncbi:MAG: cell division FtsA domain-containing protein [Candidatus Omnitrophica bacterium]|nr:cell division FtsA domain-containing protein [Candidatus Omnitrophota bacterium]
MAYNGRLDKEAPDSELARVRDKLLSINQKVRKFSQLYKKPSSRDEEEYTHEPKDDDEEVSLEVMHSKLRAINDYIKNRALGKSVKPPVFQKQEKRKEPEAPIERPEKKTSQIPRFTEREEVEELVDEPDPGAGKGVNVQPAEVTTVNLPDNVADSEKEVHYRSGVGLYLGTANIVASREVDGKRVFVRNERNAFLAVRGDKGTKELLEKLKIKYVALQDKLYVLGSMALSLADIFGRETQRSLDMGILNPSESESIPIVKLLVENILWPPRKKGEVCCFSIPSQPIDRSQDTVYHRGVFEGILRNMGFEPLIIEEGYAVILAEMESSDFTGIGVSCGAGMVSVSVAFNSVPVDSFSITRGGDWIDKSAASVLGVPTTRVTAIKEQGINIKEPRSREEEAIAIYYRNYIHHFLENMGEALGKKAGKANFDEPADIVFAGGSTMAEGFLEVVKEEIKTVNFRIPIGTLRRAEEPSTSVARGCLFNAINAEIQE